MRILIAYYSLSGNNELLARDLQRKLGCDIFKIEETRRRTKFTIMIDRIFNRNPKVRDYSGDLKRYDHLILMAPIWAGAIATPMKSFLLKEGKNIKSCSFISLCGGIAGQKKKVASEVSMLTRHALSDMLELWIADFKPPDKKDAQSVIKYKVTPSDLERVSQKIEDFVDSLDKVLL